MSNTRLTTYLAALVIVTAAACSDDTTAKPDAAPCVPMSCQSESKDCGTMPDGCGGSVACGSCIATETCGAGGVANVCGAGSCTPITCAVAGKECGTISDGCADVLDCGTCTAPKTCGGGGVANICGVKPDAGGPATDAASGACDPTCMAQSGAVCCTTCGCGGAAVKCAPVCDAPAKWDCEMSCCFDYTNKTCV